MQTVSTEDIYKILYRENRDPFQILGNHKVKIENKTAISIRAHLPRAEKAFVIDLENGKEYQFNKLHDMGFFEAIFLDKNDIFKYKIKTINYDGYTTSFYDSYSFLPGLTDFDIYLIQEGCHYKTYEKLGSHFMTMNGIGGVYFAVWAPNAKSVSVIASFNQWDPRMHIMRSLGTSGVWEIFIPGINEGQSYKYKIMTHDGSTMDKADPHAFYSELSPSTASITYDIDKYNWNDSEWLEKRKEKIILTKLFLFMKFT